MQIDLEVLRDAQAGNAMAFNQVVLAYRGRIIRTVAGLIGRTEDAEDVAQEVFTRLYFSLHDLRELKLFEIWLHRITMNAAYDYLRGPRGRRARAEARMSDLSELQMNLAQAVAAQEAHSDERNHERLRGLVQELLSVVSEADRVLLILREVEGWSVRDLAPIYQATESALKVRLFRARQRVLRALQNRPDLECVRGWRLQGEPASGE
jgi:RNA polymerase sigma-70 factor, ECF subfamily